MHVLWAVGLIVLALVVFLALRVRMPVAPEQQSLGTMPSGQNIQVTRGVKHSVPLEEVIGGGPPKDGIPPIDAPKFTTLSERDPLVRDDGTGLVLTANDDARFYPYQILVWHEIVNDTVGGTPVVVTYCPLCRTGIVFDRRVAGAETTFGTSGKLWNSNLVMYDRATDSYWSQVTGEAIVGERTGTKLTVIPSDTMRLKTFRERYPQGKVLSTETGHRREYTRDPYGDYYTSRVVTFPVNNTDDRLHPKALVHGLVVDGQAVAFVVDPLLRERVHNAEIGGTPLLIIGDPEAETIRVFTRKVGNRVLTFEDDSGILRDAETRTTWSREGRGEHGPLRNTTLERLPSFPVFWFSWVAVHPNTLMIP